MPIDVREYWNFDDPAASEISFRDLLATGGLDRHDELEVWAQIARTFSLRRDCPQCHALLDEHWNEAIAAGGRPKASFELERGRAYRTGKEIEKAFPFFEQAAQSNEDDLKVDAMHMLAIIAEPQEGIRINSEAISVAKASSSLWAQRWQGTLHNNIAWTYFEQEEYRQALQHFQKALESRIQFNQTSGIRIAKWCVGRCHRAVGNLAEALDIQTSLLYPEADGYVYEELGENLFAQGKGDEAKPHFAKAVELLANELGSDSERIQRMKSLCQQ
jgi:tetratricopeptide (TPR) repeat protein